MACILLWSSAMKVHDSQAYRKMAVTRERISRILELREMFLSFRISHLIQRPGYQRGSPCQDPAGNRTTQRPDHRKETQTAVVWSCLPFIGSSQNYLARHSERGKKTRQTEEEVGRQHQGMDRPEVRQVPKGSGEQGKMEETGCKIICGAPTS